MSRTLAAVLLAFLCPSLFAQLRVDAGIAVGTQSYESGDVDSPVLIGPELLLSRGRNSLYYALDHADLSSAGTLYANHFGLARRWPLGGNYSLLAGAGPSYVTVEHLGGEWTFNAELELALRSGRFEWFAKARYYDYSLSAFRVAESSPGGPALLGGVRFRFAPAMQP